MHIGVSSVLCTGRKNFSVYKTHFEHLFSGVVYWMNDLILYELDVQVNGLREDVFGDLSPEVGTGVNMYNLFQFFGRVRCGDYLVD